MACQESPVIIMIQEVWLLRFKEETFKDHLACCKWLLRIYRIIKCKRNSFITRGLTQLPSLLGSQMHSRLPKKPGKIAKPCSGRYASDLGAPPAFTAHQGGATGLRGCHLVQNVSSGLSLHWYIGGCWAPAMDA